MTDANAAADPPGPTIAILADDLIWATRLADAVTAAGGVPERRRRLEDVGVDTDYAIVDLTSRAYDGVEAIRQIVLAGARVVAVGQHDDVALRRAALAAGAERVHTYRALFEDGPGAIARWLGR